MHLSRTALMVTAAVGAVIIVVIAAMIFMGLFGWEEPTRDDPRSLHEGVCPEGHRALRAGRQTEDNRILQRSREHGRQWYGVIIDGNGYTIAHYNPERRGLGPGERVDATGRFFGDDVMAATGDGHWVEFVFLNPETGQNQKKHTWVVRHDDLIFGSGWYGE